MYLCQEMIILVKLNLSIKIMTVTLIISVIILLSLGIGVFAPHKISKQEYSDYELDGMDGELYGKYMGKNKEWQRGFDIGAKRLKTEKRQELISESEQSIFDNKDEYDKGYFKAIMEL